MATLSVSTLRWLKVKASLVAAEVPPPLMPATRVTLGATVLNRPDGRLMHPDTDL